MPVPTINFDDLVQHFFTLGLRAGQAVAVHSKLSSYGRIDGGAEAVYDALRRVLGPDGTLVFPAYTLNLNADDLYDPVNTPTHGMGVLSEYVRTLQEARRSNCPMHGHLAIGSLAESVMQADPRRPLGQGSEFSVMLENDFQLLLLGCNFQESVTFVHHVEAVVGVPYRSWLELPRQRVDYDGSRVAMICYY